MALETLEGLPEEVTKLYSKGADGKFHLTEPAGDDAKGLKSALQKEREARDIAEKALKAKQEAEENAKLEAERKSLEAKGEYEKLSAGDKKRIQELEAELGKRGAEHEQYVKHTFALSHLGTLAVNERALEVLASDLESKIELVQGKPVVKGDPSKDIKALVAEITADPLYAPFLRGSGASGPGGNPNPGGGAPASARAKYDALMAKTTPLTPSENRELVVLGGQLQTELNNASKKE
jgi:hypothetical protein